jgi:hypothetical protein
MEEGQEKLEPILKGYKEGLDYQGEERGAEEDVAQVKHAAEFGQECASVSRRRPPDLGRRRRQIEPYLELAEFWTGTIDFKRVLGPHH